MQASQLWNGQGKGLSSIAPPYLRQQSRECLPLIGARSIRPPSQPVNSLTTSLLNVDANGRKTNSLGTRPKIRNRRRTGKRNTRNLLRPKLLAGPHYRTGGAG